MALKACAYKDCENYELNGSRTGNFCMFAFPKNEQRREEWKELGKVLNNIPEQDLYMCSDHFEDKYVSKSSRRWNLVSTAKPKPYSEEMKEEQDPDDFCEERVEFSVDYSELLSSVDLDESMTEEALEQKDSENDNYLVESTVPEDGQDDGGSGAYETVEFLEDTYKGSQIEDHVLYKKRKFSSMEHNSSSSRASLKILNFAVEKQQKIVPKTNNSHNSSHNNSSNNIKNISLMTLKAPEIQPKKPTGNQGSLDDNGLVNGNEVSVFMFKGEEYVQMSKEYYVKEKLEMLKKLRSYENSFRRIKQSVDLATCQLNK